jgi:hypothetical protein
MEHIISGMYFAQLISLQIFNSTEESNKGDMVEHFIGTFMQIIQSRCPLPIDAFNYSFFYSYTYNVRDQASFCRSISFFYCKKQ